MVTSRTASGGTHTHSRYTALGNSVAVTMALVCRCIVGSRNGRDDRENKYYAKVSCLMAQGADVHADRSSDVIE